MLITKQEDWDFLSVDALHTSSIMGCRMLLGYNPDVQRGAQRWMYVGVGLRLAALM